MPWRVGRSPAPSREARRPTAWPTRRTSPINSHRLSPHAASENPPEFRVHRLSGLSEEYTIPYLMVSRLGLNRCRFFRPQASSIPRSRVPLRRAYSPSPLLSQCVIVIAEFLTLEIPNEIVEQAQFFEGHLAGCRRACDAADPVCRHKNRSNHAKHYLHHG